MDYPGPPPGLSAASIGHEANGSLKHMTHTTQLAEDIVNVRDQAKSIGRVLFKLEKPKAIMIVAKATEPRIVEFTRNLTTFLIDTPRQCSSTGLTLYVDQQLRNHPSFDYDDLIRRYPHYESKLYFWTPEFCASPKTHEIIDVIITLGGDGTVLYASWLFQHSQVPPVIPFHLGSLGFLTNFHISNIKGVLERMIGASGDGVRVNMRMRLTCTLWRAKGRSKYTNTLQFRDYGQAPPRMDGQDSDVVVTLEPALDDPETSVPARLSKSSAYTSSSPSLFPETCKTKPELFLGTQLKEKCPIRPPPGGDSTPALTRVRAQGHALHPAQAPTRDRPPVLDSAGLSDTAAQGSTALAPALLSNARLTDSSLSVGSADGPGRKYSGRHPVSSAKPVPTETFHILNDLVVDRGPSAYMSQLELYVDERHLTTVQADGLVISTPTGSTAYSLSAGGSLVHPEVPSILVSPICPHTLSFRPMLLPDSIDLKIQVPQDSRNTAWASFDGRHRIELRQGDFIRVTMSRWPMPTICSADQTTDWFESLRRCLHWNERTRQKPFGDPNDGPPMPDLSP